MGASFGVIGELRLSHFKTGTSLGIKTENSSFGDSKTSDSRVFGILRGKFSTIFTISYLSHLDPGNFNFVCVRTSR